MILYFVQTFSLLAGVHETDFFGCGRNLRKILSARQVGRYDIGNQKNFASQPGE